MEKKPGLRENSFRYSYDGFDYHLNKRKRTDNSEWYTCANKRSKIDEKKCVAEAKVSADGEVTIIGEHLHGRSTWEERQKIIKTVKDEALTSNQPVSAIVKELYKTNNEAQGVMTAKTARATGYRARMKRPRPEIPADLNNFREDTLRQYTGPGGGLFRGIIKVEEGDQKMAAVLFGSARMVRHLAVANKLTVDVNFRRMPKSPKCDQMMVLYLHHSEKRIPVMFILLSTPNEALYKAIWNKLIDEKILSMHHMKTVYVDYDVRLIRSIRDTMLKVRLRGTWDSFKRAIQRKWNALQLPNNSAPREVLHATWALPLLPAEKIGVGINSIKKLMDTEQFEQLATFREHLENFWKCQSKVISIAENREFLNTDVEDLNRQLRNNLTERGNKEADFWLYLEKLANIVEQRSEKQWDTLHQDPPPKQKKTTVRPDNDAFKRVTVEVKSGRYGRLSKILLASWKKERLSEVEIFANQPKERDDNLGADHLPNLADLQDPEEDDVNEQIEGIQIVDHLLEVGAEEEIASAGAENNEAVDAYAAYYNHLDNTDVEVALRRSEDQLEKIDYDDDKTLPDDTDDREKAPRMPRCLICMERQALNLVLPCGHLCLCIKCREKSKARWEIQERYGHLPKKYCPHCTRPVEEIRRAFY